MSIHVNASFRYMERLFTYKKMRADYVRNVYRPGRTKLPTGVVHSVASNSHFHWEDACLFRYAVRQPGERNLDKLGRSKFPHKLRIRGA